MKKITLTVLSVLICLATGMTSCKKKSKEKEKDIMQQKVEEFASFDLNSDLINRLSDKEKQILPILVQIADIMDDLFWKQTFGDKTILDTISCKWTKDFAVINYGFWERLNDNKPFIPDCGEKPLGAQLYPADITKDEYEKFGDPNKGSLYTVLRRNEDGSLKTVWYRDEYKAEISRVNELLDQAIELAEDSGFKQYLTKRKKAFETDDYFASDIAWMDMKESKIDFVVGPIENYDDKLNEAKASYEAFILLKDVERSKELAKFTAMLPQLQKELPCNPQYKTFVPGTSSDLNVYDAVYYAGDCNSGSKTIAINLPNDERVHAVKGTRRLQLRNSMQAKFDKILLPIGDLVLEPSLQGNLKFNAFFWNVTFHEVAHGLGVKHTVNGKGSVDNALGPEKTSWEEAKADILGLFMVCNLIEKDEIQDITVEDAITTFIAGILRSVRFGAASSHGKANMMCYNYMEKENAFTREEDGMYHIDFDKAKDAINSWSNLILKVQGEGDFEFAKQFRAENGTIGADLQAVLNKINQAGIPRDIRFNQGLDVMGLD